MDNTRIVPFPGEKENNTETALSDVQRSWSLQSSDQKSWESTSMYTAHGSLLRAQGMVRRGTLGIDRALGSCGAPESK